MYLHRIIIILLLTCSLAAEARMYQWRDPKTGTTQLSGKPPSWYRTDEKGPRVIVFDKGKIIDDTAIPLDRGQRRALRRQAMLSAEEDIESAKAKAIEAETIKSAIGNGSRDLNEGKKTPPPEEALPADTESIPSQQLESLENLSREEMLELVNKLDEMLESPEQPEAQVENEMTGK